MDVIVCVRFLLVSRSDCCATLLCAVCLCVLWFAARPLLVSPVPKPLLNLICGSFSDLFSPYNDKMVFENLHSEIPKAKVTKILMDLTEKGKGAFGWIDLARFRAPCRQRTYRAPFVLTRCKFFSFSVVYSLYTHFTCSACNAERFKSTLMRSLCGGCGWRPFGFCSPVDGGAVRAAVGNQCTAHHSGFDSCDIDAYIGNTLFFRFPLCIFTIFSCIVSFHSQNVTPSRVGLCGSLVAFLDLLS